MYNLEELKNGMHCTITWLLGDVGTFLKKKYHFALDASSAHAIKVTI